MPGQLHAIHGVTGAMQALADEAHLRGRAGEAVDQQYPGAPAAQQEICLLDHGLRHASRPRNSANSKGDCCRLFCLLESRGQGTLQSNVPGGCGSAAPLVEVMIGTCLSGHHVNWVPHTSATPITIAAVPSQRRFETRSRSTRRLASTTPTYESAAMGNAKLSGARDSAANHSTNSTA